MARTQVQDDPPVITRHRFSAEEKVRVVLEGLRRARG